ncbi:hypothetical protein [Nostoc sp. CHAB 5715]|uniref:hypothetical protein n=1 Tax=Nostoc sp. CHAB 5715 TaxID=2780400 RepID=UPI001E302DD0|nr:hypothetical protein [Nostoc sp. CHAB 5715]MCC5625172.1 hypothetical protein [Nostoc sp. CHAB 5715]
MGSGGAGGAGGAEEEELLINAQFPTPHSPFSIPHSLLPTPHSPFLIYGLTTTTP